MICGYWLFCSLKDPILTALCGVMVIPKANMLSVFVVLGVVAVYNHLLDSDTPNHHLLTSLDLLSQIVLLELAVSGNGNSNDARVTYIC
eukprot:5595721-Ditylum_brightwellii.AAC.1